LTVNNGITWSAPAWDGNSGGIFVVAARGDFTVDGTISILGVAGIQANQSLNNTAGDGCHGGRGAGYQPSNKGEGTSGYIVAGTSANGTGGGGASHAVGGGVGGGGGGCATAGGNGSGIGGGGTAGTGGSALATDVSLATKFIFGGGGGGGSAQTTDGGGQGGCGAGLGLVFAKNIITSSGLIQINGGGGGGGSGSLGRNGGSGAGGCFLIKCGTATLGSTKITATGAAGAYGGGAGGNGRIRCDYGESVSGTTNPTLSSALDSSLVEGGGEGGFLFNFV